MACYEKGFLRWLPEQQGDTGRGSVELENSTCLEEKPHLCWEEEGHSLSWILAGLGF